MSKKIVSVIISALILCFVFTAAAAAAEPGDTVSVSVSISGNSGIAGLKIKTSYDSEVMTLKSASDSGLLAGYFSNTHYGDNPYSSLWSNAENSVGDGVILTLEFELKDDAADGTYPVSVEVDSAFDQSDNNVPVSVSATSVTVERRHEHEWNAGEVTKAATCKEEGVMTYTCTKCPETKTEAIPLDPSNHADYGTEVRNRKAATGNEDGYTGDICCKGCGAVITAGKPIPAGYETGTLVTFGSYPQSKVTDASLLESLNALTFEWKTYDYFAEGRQEKFMEYSDVSFSDSRYRAVRFSHYRTASDAGVAGTYQTYQDNNDYHPGQVYWFKSEPIVWRILDAGSGLMMTEKIIDSQPFNSIKYINEDGDFNWYSDEEYAHYASNWSYSSLRKWMNDDLYNTAFDTEKSCICEVMPVASTSEEPGFAADTTADKLFLLAKADVQNEDYGFVKDDIGNFQSVAAGTDYARCQGLFTTGGDTNKYNSKWHLIDPIESLSTVTVDEYGYVNEYGEDVTSTEIGVRSAVCIDLQSAVRKSLIQITDGTEIIPGDVNGDGVVLANDARLALRASAKLEVLTDEQTLAADVNGDDKVLADDARQILRFSAKLQTAFDKKTA